MFQFFQKLVRNTDGNVALIFGLAALPLTLVIGLAMDWSRTEGSRADLQLAADAAVLAAAANANLDKDDMEKLADKVFAANSAQFGWLASTRGKLVNKGPKLRYDATANVPTLFGGLVGHGHIPVNVSAEAGMAGGKGGTEVVFMMDTTASMSFGVSWSTTIRAIEDALDDLKKYSDEDEFYVSLVPFSDRVNVGKAQTSWLTTPVPGWNGCVEPREENYAGNPYELTDKNPGQLKFKPNAPGHYIVPSLFAIYGWANCPYPVIGPYHDPDDVADKMSNLHPGGTGRFDVGLAWGWRMLSENWQGYWGESGYPAKTGDRRKIAVFFTDGYTEAYATEVGQSGHPWGWNKGSPKGFENFVRVCKGMKKDGIEVYAIYVKGNHRIVPYMQDCATDADHYFEVRNLTTLNIALDALQPGEGDVRLIH